MPVTITPHFRDFLPPWLAGQPWFAGTSPARPVAFYRLEDPAGQVGMEAHLLTDGTSVCHVPMTYRGAPLAGADAALIATAEHSELGTRWIYDAEADPVWRAEVLRLIRAGGTSDRERSRGAEAHGELLRDADLSAATIEVCRVLGAGYLPPGAAGVLRGSWTGPDGTPVAGHLAIVRA